MAGKPITCNCGASACMSRRRVSYSEPTLHERHMLFASHLHFQKVYSGPGRPCRSITIISSHHSRLAKYHDACVLRRCYALRPVTKANDGCRAVTIGENRRGKRQARQPLGRGYWRDMLYLKQEVLPAVVTTIAQELEKINGELANGED